MKCARKGCARPVPPSKRKYCSDRCCKIANAERIQAHRREPMDEAVSHRFRHRKTRVCLGCSRDFMSSGPWNRLCPSCKQKGEGAHRTHSTTVPRQWLSSLERETE